MVELLKGAPVAAVLQKETLTQTCLLKEQGIFPTLAILRVGARESDMVYERSIAACCEEAGITLRRYFFPIDCTKATVLDCIRSINEDPSVHGCLVFRPLPDPDTETAICTLLAPEKDVDGMTYGFRASAFSGEDGYPPCTAQACTELLDYYGIPIAGKRVTVIGRGLSAGRPISLLLSQREAAVTVCHSRTMDLAAACKNADILVAAAGKAGLIDGACMASGQIILDVGINTAPDGSLCGDVDADAAMRCAAAYTPVPGGIGRITAAVLCKHTVKAAQEIRKRNIPQTGPA